MKQFSLFILASLLYANSGFSQTLQATIVPGSVRNSIFIKVKSKGAAITPTVPISTVNFCIQVKDTLPLPKPTLAVAEKLVSTAVGTYNVTDVSSETPGFYTWNIDGTDGTTATTWAADEEITFIEVFFNDAGNATTYSRLVHLPEGGLTGASTFYLSIGGNPVVLDNELLYGMTAVNETAGVYPAGNAVVTLPGLVLPVKFTGFNVLKGDNKAFLTWSIENESPLAVRYEVQRSLNGTDFTTVSSISPRNNGLTSNSYDFTDDNLNSIRTSGVIYYRIKQIDQDGRFVMTDIKSIRLGSVKGFVVSAFPNPTKDYTKLSLDLTANTDVIISITDAAGKQVQTIQMQGMTGINVKRVDLSKFAAGSYTFKVQAGTDVKTISVVKTN